MKCITRFIFVAVLSTLAPYGAMAQQGLDCRHSESAFCDASWKGADAFKKTVLDLKIKTFYHETIDESAIRTIAGESVHVWIAPGYIEPSVVHSMIEAGARLLVFDETAMSVDLFSETYHHPAIEVESPFLPEASHINGNRNLPVLAPDPGMIKAFGLPESAEKWQIAYNHPTPLASRIEGQVLIYHSYALARQEDEMPENKSKSGRLVAFRDESIPIRLMLNTLDNRRLLTAILASFCADRENCSIHLYEPGAVFLSAPPAPLSWQEEWAESMEQAKVRLQEKKDEIKTKAEPVMAHFPWKLFLFAVIMAWTILTLFAVFPVGRSRKLD